MKPAQGHHACAANVVRGGEDMKAKLLGAITLAVLLLLVFAVVAQAAVPQSVIDAIVKDAADGHIDGNWTTAQIRAALRYVENNPILDKYSKIKGVLEDYLASLQARQIILEDALDLRVLVEDRVVLDVPQGSADLCGRPVAVDVAVCGVLDDRVDDRLRDRSLSDHGEHQEKHHGKRDGAHQFGLHIFTSFTTFTAVSCCALG